MSREPCSVLAERAGALRAPSDNPSAARALLREAELCAAFCENTMHAHRVSRAGRDGGRAGGRGTLVHEHGGTMPGFSATIRLAPERRLRLAILTNLDNAPLRRIAQIVMAQALDLPEAAPPTPTEAPVTPNEMASLPDRYENRGTADLTVQDRRVMLSLDGGTAMGVCEAVGSRLAGSRLGASRLRLASRARSRSGAASAIVTYDRVA